MDIKIHHVRDIGRALRAARKHSNVRLDDLAGFARVSKQFVSDLEHGKPTVRLGLVLKVLEELGVHVKLEIPDAARERWEALQDLAEDLAR